MRGPITAIGLAALLALGGGALAQEAAPPDATPLPAAPKPRPKARPKPAPKVEPPAASDPADQAKPDAVPPEPRPNPSQGAFAAPPVACDPGQSVLYDAPRDVAVWVTRSGSVTVENPLRPLTPDKTRVLQTLVGGKLATAYGPDLVALRRGGPPGALEAQLGGPIRWDASLATLPDTLDITDDAGKTLAELRFKQCGEAPAAKAASAPVGKARPKPKAERKPVAVPAEAPAAAPPLRQLPRGALPD